MPDSPLRATARIFQDASSLLEGTLDNLDHTIQDLPRLQKVLHTEKIFGIVPELDLEQARKAAHTEIEPQLTHLRGLIEKKIASLRRKKVGLESQAQLLHVRLQNAEKSSPKRPNAASASEAELARLRFLRNKSDRLRYSLIRLRSQKSASLGRVPSLSPGK